MLPISRASKPAMAGQMKLSARCVLCSLRQRIRAAIYFCQAFCRGMVHCRFPLAVRMLNNGNGPAESWWNRSASSFQARKGILGRHAYPTGLARSLPVQIGCGDLFANGVVDKFNACAISDNPCVPQKPDENLYPIPPDTALVPSFEVERLKGVWYISAGQNPTFDTFDCQLHTFNPTSPTTFVANLTWRIRTPDGGFFTRSADQEFVQQTDKPALLLNHDNEFLHYQDDW